MGALAKHHVDQDDGRLGIVARGGDGRAPQRGVDHRMGAAARVLGVAEVDEAVGAGADEAARLLAERATRVEAAHAARAAPGSRRDRRTLELGRRRPQRLQARECRRFERLHRADTSGRRSLPAEQTGDDGLARGAGGGQHALGDAGRGRLGHEREHPRVGIQREPAQRLERREPADHRIEVTAAGADRLRDAAAETVQETRDLLQPRARRADQPDRAAANTVGEADPDSVEDGGSALGAHHEEPGARGAPLESDLLLERDAVTEDEDVMPGGERLMSLVGGVGSRHGDDCEARARLPPDRAPDGPAGLVDGRLVRPWPLGQQSLGGLQGRVGRRLARRPHGEHEVGDAGRVAVRWPQAGSGEGAPIRLRGHEELHRAHAGKPAQRVGHLHQPDGVDVRTRPDLAEDDQRNRFLRSFLQIPECAPGCLP